MKKKIFVFSALLLLVFSCLFVACAKVGTKSPGNTSKDKLNAALSIENYVTSENGTVAYEEINSDFHSLLYSRNGEVYAVENSKPLVLTATESDTTFEFQPILRLDKMDIDFNFIEFLVIPGSYDPSIKPNSINTAPITDFSGIEVVLTDVSDPTKTLTYQTIIRTDNNYETSALAGGNGQTVQGKFLNGTFQKGFGLQVRQPFNGIFNGAKYAGGYSFDPDENAAYAYPSRNLDHHVIRDLDYKDDLNGNEPWSGFSSNEVKVSLRFMDLLAKEAKIAILSFNGAFLGEDFSDTEGPQIEPYAGFDENVQGEKLTPFPVPEIFAYDDYDGVVEQIDIKVYYDYGTALEKEYALEGGSFIPDKAGVYTIVARAFDKSGNSGEKLIDITVADKLVPLSAVFDGELPVNISMGEYVYCPNAEISGGTVGKGYRVEITDPDGKQITLDLNGKFLADKQGVYRIRYVVYDYLENYVYYDFYSVANVNNTPIVEWPYIPEILARNYVFDIPSFKAEDWYSYISPVDAIVTAYLKKPGESEFTALESMSFSSDTAGENILKLEVRAHKGTGVISKEFSINVIDARYVRDYFVTDNMTVINQDNVIRFRSDSTSKAGSISFINPLMADNFEIRFTNNSPDTVENAGDAYQAVEYAELVLTDKDDITQSITVRMEGSTRYTGKIIFEGKSYEVKSSFDVSKPFSLSFNNGSLYNLGEKLAQVTEYDNGEPFDGFTEGYVFAKLIVKTTRNDAVIQIRSLCQHSNFNYAATDNSRPIVKIMGELVTSVNIGDVVNVPEFRLFDVFSGKCEATTTVKYNDEVIVSHNGPIQFTATNHGVYVLQAFGQDASGNSIAYPVNIYCNNLTKPTISMSGSVQEWGKVGEEIILPGATALNSAGEAIEVHVLVTNPSGSAVNTTDNADNSGVTFTPDRPGKYVEYYHAYDSDFNAQWLKFAIEVTEK